MILDQLINILISGIKLSVIYCLMALGFTIVYGVGKIFNYAHGAFFTWGAYIAWFLSAGFFHLNYILSFVLTIPIMFLFGVVFERITIYPLRKRPNWTIAVFIVTLGAALFLDSLALVCFGPRFKRLPPLLEGTYNFSGYVIGRHDALLVIIVIFIVVVLGLFLSKSREGMVMRAVSQDTLGARISGVPIDRVFSGTFGISAVLAGISGMLLTPKTLLFPVVGWPILFKAFVIVVFGGLGSIQGTIYAAFILGMVEAFVAFYIGGIWGLPVFLIILMVVLVARPQGLFGTGA